MTTCKLSGLICPSFAELHRDMKTHSHSEYVLKGGRGSTKSSFLSIQIILLLLRTPNLHAVVLRKRENRLRTSVFSQIQWAVMEMGLYEQFKFTTSPMEITYKSTRQKILFFGMDDPGKIKSIKAPFGYIGILWFEELDQFSGPEEVRNVEQSVLRGGDTMYCFKSFNPPQTAANWANKYVQIPKPGRLVHHSTYREVPPEWLGKRFLADAEYLSGINPRAYEHEYLGVPNGTGGSVFDNVTLREITGEENRRFDWIYRGIDWGWYPDPFRYVKMSYQANERKLYLLDEISGNKLPNRTIAELLRQHGVQNGDWITADSGGEGMKSIADLKSMGFNLHPAAKGPGSVEYSTKWLASLNEIVIDPKRCPHAAEEFLNYEYERDKNGEVVSGFPDKDNHSIDAVRYALERVWRTRGR